MAEIYHAEQDATESNDEVNSANETNNLPKSLSNDSDESGSATVTDSESNKASTGNAWNHFQHEHAGQGLSSTEMSGMYHAQQNTPQSDDQTSTTNETNNSSEGPTNDNNESMPATATDSDANLEPDKPSSSNPWNDFQHEHAGEGLSHAEMTEAYHVQQNAAKSGNETSTTATDFNKSTEENTWNDFQHKHAGEGKTSSELADMYHKENDAQNSVQQSSTTVDEQSQNQTPHTEKQDKMLNDITSKFVKESQIKNEDKTVSSSTENQTLATNLPQHRYNQKSRPSIQWNLFQHLHRGQYSSKQEMSTAYKQFKENEKSFKWNPDYQLNLTSDGKLQDPNSSAGQEAMKTGLFDEKNRLRRHRDIPYSIFQSKMFDMNITDRSK
ncbi:unnamed protein product, partial [Rotaria sordida]